jgi:hypothetical protein
LSAAAPDRSGRSLACVGFLFRYYSDPYKRRNVIERMFCRLKDWRRIATRYDKLAINFTAAIAIAAIITWWAD